MDQFNVKALRGTPLNPSGMIATRLGDEIVLYIDRMVRETRRELRALNESFVEDWAMDASYASQARIVLNKLTDRFTSMFNRIASPMAQQWVEQVNKNTASGLTSSLKEIAGHMTLKTDILGDELKDVLTASVNASVDLIKTVPNKFFDQIKGDVMRSIQTGGAENDLEKSLEQYGNTTRNWARNVAMDQTRKAYNSLAMGRMEKLGIDSYEWVHSGGSNHPRKLHQELNGKIFRFDDPPIIQKGGKSGEIRGIPGQLPYCRCIMRPVLNFKDDDDE